MVMMVWQAELHQGKQSIILDAKKDAEEEESDDAFKTVRFSVRLCTYTFLPATDFRLLATRNVQLATHNSHIRVHTHPCSL